MVREQENSLQLSANTHKMECHPCLLLISQVNSFARAITDFAGEVSHQRVPLFKVMHVMLKDLHTDKQREKERESQSIENRNKNETES